MKQLLIIGTCLTAAVAAGQSVESVNVSPGERGPNSPETKTAAVRGAPPWWSDHAAADAPAAGAEAAQYGSAVADDTQPKAAVPQRPVRADGESALAPDPPSRAQGGGGPDFRAGPGMPARRSMGSEHGTFPFAANRPSSVEFPERTANAVTVPSSPVHLAATTEPVAEQAKKDKPAEANTAASDVFRAPRGNMPPAALSPPRPIKPPAALPAANPAAPLSAASSAASSATSAATSAAAPSQTLGSHGDKGLLGKTSPLSAMFTVGGSLSIVVGLFLVVAWAMRKTAPRGSLVLPREVFEILGRAPIGARQQVQLLRCGNKLLLVSITPQGVETLTEVTDPLEVDRVAGICQQGNPKSSTSAFRQVFQQIAADPEPASGHPTRPADKTPADDELQLGGPRRKRYRWEEKHA